VVVAWRAERSWASDVPSCWRSSGGRTDPIRCWSSVSTHVVAAARSVLPVDVRVMSDDRRSLGFGRRVQCPDASIRSTGSTDGDDHVLGDVVDPAGLEAGDDLHRLEPAERQAEIATETLVDGVPQLDLEPDQVVEDPRQLCHAPPPPVFHRCSFHGMIIR